jgi:hypothetical protein
MAICLYHWDCVFNFLNHIAKIIIKVVPKEWPSLREEKTAGRMRE